MFGIPDLKDIIPDALKSLSEHVAVELDTTLFRAEIKTKFVPAPTPDGRARLYVYLISHEVQP